MYNPELAVTSVTSEGATVRHLMPFGAEILSDGHVRFRLWAPACETVMLKLENVVEPLRLEALPDGWHELVTSRAGVGSRYSFELPNGLTVPDPASRYQPNDVHGPSEVIDPSRFPWSDAGWRPRPWPETVLYELHVGTFTPEGTFAAVIGKLGHLAALGVTVIELMPIADFPGRCDWGYDGAYLFAPDASYGTPDDLRRLVDAAHAHGLAVLLDVVYNHFGPEGNYLSTYAPHFFTDRHKTPWGDAINYDGPGSKVVRDFVVHNALYWLEEFHIDGLRLDAIHAIIDTSVTPLVIELAERVRALDLNRTIPILVENEDNEAADLARVAGMPKRYTAQWNDDVHHVLHTAATSEGAGYYADYLGDTDKLGRALAEGFAFQGELMAFRGSPRGEPSGSLPPDAFVGFVQNHDQIGNRAFGDRLVSIASGDALRAVTATLLLLPQIPMLFMGEEWGTAKPFPFFCDFSGELGEAVRKGRREEFKHDPALRAVEGRAEVPDPQSVATFESAKLDWTEIDQAPHRTTLEWYRRILEVRKHHIAPLTAKIMRGGTYVPIGSLAVSVTWQATAEVTLRLDINLKAEEQRGFAPADDRVVWQEGAGDASGTLGPWSIRCSVSGAS